MKTLDHYFPVVARSTSCNGLAKGKQANESHRWHPYQKRSGDSNPSRAAATNFLLRTLSSPSNPITHADTSARADRVVSTASGHQVAEERMNRRLYLRDRERKLTDQKEKCSGPSGLILRHARIYIDGYLEGTTDIEIKRLIALGGGHVMQTQSGCTHIVTSRCLSGSKTHKFLAGRNVNKIHVVKPEWVIDSISTGKRQSEHRYSIIREILKQ